MPLDAGGPLSRQRRQERASSTSACCSRRTRRSQVNDLVLLEDDKHLQKADNLVPVVRHDVLDDGARPAGPDQPVHGQAHPGGPDRPQQAGHGRRQGLQGRSPRPGSRPTGSRPGGTSGSGITVKVGSTNFYEQEILGEIFAQVLEANGFTVERKFQLGNREIVFPALQKGDIDILAEYAATALEYVNKGAGEATGDAAETVAKLKDRLAPLKGLTALDFAPATDQNGFVVTKATADKYKLTKLSDLAKPAP